MVAFLARAPQAHIAAAKKYNVQSDAMPCVRLYLSALNKLMMLQHVTTYLQPRVGLADNLVVRVA